MSDAGITLPADEASKPAARRPAINPWLIAPLVALAAFMEVLDIAIANVSLRHIAGSLAAGPEEATWVLTAYLVTNAIALPISGWLSEHFGRVRFYLACIIGFTLASMACGLATSLPALIAFRALQGLAGGALQPVSQAILADTFSVKQRPMAFAFYGIAVVSAPAIGPTLGGWITDQFSWHWIFLINVPIGIVLVLLIRRFMPPEAPTGPRGRIDYFGFGLIAIGLGSLQWVLDRGQNADWFDSRLIVTLTILVVVCLVTYAVRSLDIKRPIVDLSLYRHRNYAVANGLMFVLGFVLIGSTAMMPLFMQTFLNYTATDAGLVLSPGGLVIMLMMPVVGLLSSRIDNRLLITFGLIATATALWHMGNFNLLVDQSQLALARAWQGVGLAFLFIPITSVAYYGLPANMNNQAAAMLSFMRNMGGGVGIALLITMLARMGTQNRQIMAAHTAPYDSEWQASQALLQQLMGDSERALAMGAIRLQQQADLMAYLDGFRLLALMFVLLIPLVWLLKPGHGAAPEGAH